MHTCCWAWQEPFVTQNSKQVQWKMQARAFCCRAVILTLGLFSESFHHRGGEAVQSFPAHPFCRAPSGSGPPAVSGRGLDPVQVQGAGRASETQGQLQSEIVGNAGERWLLNTRGHGAISAQRAAAPTSAHRCWFWCIFSGIRRSWRLEPPSAQHAMLTLHRQISVCHIQSISSGVIFLWCSRYFRWFLGQRPWFCTWLELFCFHRCSDFCRTEHFLRHTPLKPAGLYAGFLVSFFKAHFWHYDYKYYFVIL